MMNKSNQYFVVVDDCVQSMSYGHNSTIFETASDCHLYQVISSMIKSHRVK